MDKDHYFGFLDASEKAIENRSSSPFFHLHDDAAVPFVNGEVTERCLSNSMARSIENLDEELNMFEKNFSGKNNTIYWASTYNDVFDCLKKLFKAYKVKSVRIPNVNASTIFREIGIKYFLRDEKIGLSEEGDMQFFVADYMFSDTGSLLLLNQTNNNLSKISNKVTNVFFTTIDRIVNNTNWAEVIQQLLAYRNGGGKQDMILFHSTPNCNNYLFIIDNQRSCLLSDICIRQSMTCLQCGRCKDVCPVYQTIGDEPYNNVFTGPIANVTLPWLETFDTFAHVAYSCTLCGRCEEVCPLGLNIRDMIISNRQYILANKVMGRRHHRMISAMRKMLDNRSKMNSSKCHKRHLFFKYLSSEFKRSRHVTPFSKETFNSMYKKNKENN